MVRNRDVRSGAVVVGGGGLNVRGDSFGVFVTMTNSDSFLIRLWILRI